VVSRLGKPAQVDSRAVGKHELNRHQFFLRIVDACLAGVESWGFPPLRLGAPWRPLLLLASAHFFPPYNNNKNIKFILCQKKSHTVMKGVGVRRVGWNQRGGEGLSYLRGLHSKFRSTLRAMEGIRIAILGATPGAFPESAEDAVISRDFPSQIVDEFPCAVPQVRHKKQ